MKSFIVAALAAGALAAPYRREVITDVDMVYVTDLVTVTAGQPAATRIESVATSTAAAATSTHWPSFYSGHGDMADNSPEATPLTKPANVVSVASAPAVSAAPTEKASAWTSAWTSVWTITPSASATASSTVDDPISAPSAVPQKAASVVSSVASAVPTSYSDIVVQAHNLHRSNHSSGPLEWDTDLVSSAQTIAESCVYGHDMNVNGGGYGQNIAAGTESTNISAVITEQFYNGEVGWFADYYGQAQPDMTNFGHWGHFSQVVWNATTHVGCYTQSCPNGLANVGSNVPPYFTVCNYKSAGNFANEYGANIGRPLGMPTASWNTGL